MSFISKLLKRGANEKPPTPQEAIRKLVDAEDLLKKKTEVLENKIDTELQNARRYGTKNKRLAIQALRKKKLYEKQLQQIDGTLTTLEIQRETLENVSTNKDTLNTLVYATEAMKSANEGIDIDKLNDLRDTMAEQKEMTDEMIGALSTLGYNNEYDDDELLEELEQLENEHLEKELLQIPESTVTLPKVPETELKKKQEKMKAPKKVEDSDLNELMNWAT